MKKQLLLAFMVAAMAMPAAAGLFSAKGDNVEEKRAAVRKDREEILAKLYAAHPEAKAKIQKAAGYGTFNNKNMNLFLLSSGHGYGMVVDKSGKETFMAMGSLGGGVGLGAKDLSVVFIFKNADVMKKFIESGWQFGGEADATAKAGEKGGAAAKEAGADTGANVFEIYQIDGHRRGAPGHGRGHQVLERQGPQQVSHKERNQIMKRIFRHEPDQTSGGSCVDDAAERRRPAARGGGE